MPAAAPGAGAGSSTSASSSSKNSGMDVEQRRRRNANILREFFVPAVHASRYRVDKVIGKGAYGIVVAATDLQTGQQVAVKRIQRVLDSAGMATRILRELKFLRFLHTHENIVSVKDVLVPGERDTFNDVFVVFEIMPTDLGRLLRSKTMLTEEHVKFFMFQLLRGINFLHGARVFHRDLNPHNILVNSDCQLRICDFGLARAEFQRGDDHVFWTDYVATRWYRAPELILAQSTKYSTAIDMWSAGCIFAEMLGRGKPLFPGNNARDQFLLILNVTGRPSSEVIAKLGSPRYEHLIASLPPVATPTPLNMLYPDASPGAIDLLSRLLTFDPDERITAQQALSLDYFADFRRFGLGVQVPPLDEREFAFERVRLSASQMRQQLLEEIAAHHPEARAEILGRTPRPEGLPPGPAAGIRFQERSPAQQFAEQMVRAERNTAQKSWTLSNRVFAAINSSEQPSAGVQDFKGSTMGSGELSRITGSDGGVGVGVPPQGHASCPSRLQQDGNSSGALGPQMAIQQGHAQELQRQQQQQQRQQQQQQQHQSYSRMEE